MRNPSTGFFLFVVRFRLFCVAAIVLAFGTSGCASAPVALSLAGLSAVGIGYTVVADESIIDPLVSMGEGKDCNALRMGRDGGPYCRDAAPPEKEASRHTQWCYRSLGGISCYQEPQKGRKLVHLYANSLDQQPPRQAAKQETAPSEARLSPQPRSQAAFTENEVGDFLTAPSVPEILLTGRAVEPFPESHTTKQPENQATKNQELYGGLANRLPGQLPSQRRGPEARTSTRPPTSIVRERDIPTQESLAPTLEERGSETLLFPETTHYRQGGLPAPSSGAILGAPYEDYNPSWIRSFPNSYYQPRVKQDPFLGYRLPGAN